MAAAALQVVPTIGIKRMIPLIAIGSLALGLLAGRSTGAEPAAEELGGDGRISGDSNE